MSDTRVGNVDLSVIDFHPHNVRHDLGDLRSLTESIRRFGVLQPVVLERRGRRLRIRAGHRRVAAARLAGLSRIPAVVHGEVLERDEWLTAAVHENTRRRDLGGRDRARTVRAMREAGMTWGAIAEAFDVVEATPRKWLSDDPGPSKSDERAESSAERVAETRQAVEALTREGKSAAEIALQLRLSRRTVVRYRTGTPMAPRPVRISAIRHLVTEARERVTQGAWNATDVLAALDRLASTGRVADALLDDGGAA